MKRVALAATITMTSLVCGFVLAGEAKPGALTIQEIKAALARKEAHEVYFPAAPLGFNDDAVKAGIPRDNPLTPAKVALGKQLYFDARLSADGTVSCATCHQPKLGFGDGAPVSTGIRSQKGGRSAPTVINRLFSKAQFWDGRAASLEAQALGPIANPIEMGNTLPKALATIKAIEGYRLQFAAVFGKSGVSETNLAKAIAAYERTVLSGDSVWDVYDRAQAYAQVDLDDEDLDAETKKMVTDGLAAAKRRPISEAAKRGAKLFTGKANCSLCHSNANFTDELYHNLGVGMAAKAPDWGRFAVTNKEADKGAFKTPTLRDIAATAPYMHDGSVKTLAAVVELYDRGGEKNKWLSSRMKPLGLTKTEKADLVAYLKALSGKVSGAEIPRLP